MKKSTIGILMLALSLALSLAAHGYTIHVTSTVNGALDEAVACVSKNDLAAAGQAAKNAADAFAGRRMPLAAYIPHGRLDEISVGLTRVTVYLAEDMPSDALAEINAVKYRLQILRREDGYHLDNIL